MNTDFKSKIKEVLKRNKAFYSLYYYVMSFLINVIKLFVRTDNKLILFVSFGGRRATDSPRAMYEYMRSDERFRGYKLVWGLINTKDYPEIPNKVKIDTLSYFLTALRARCWITNVLVERALNFTGKNTFYLYTGHGSPIKKCGIDENNKDHFKSNSKSSFNAVLAQSNLEKDVRGRIFNLGDEHIYMTGSPTNDILVNYKKEYRDNIRKELKIAEDKIAILYAPTFREYNAVGRFENKNVNFENWHKFLGNKFVILYRAHPISIFEQKEHCDWFVDVSNYNSIESLMIASDILISDYSGLIPDYSLTHKPIYLWLYDYEDYERARGLYFDLRKVLPWAEDEEELLTMIKAGYTDEQKSCVQRFQLEYAPIYGSGTKNAVDLIWSQIGKQ